MKTDDNIILTDFDTYDGDDDGNYDDNDGDNDVNDEDQNAHNSAIFKIGAQIFMVVVLYNTNRWWQWLWLC